MSGAGPTRLEVDGAVFAGFMDQALDQMLDACRALGDERVNASPDLAGANSPFAIVTHCLGVMRFWGGQVIAGRDIVRDRAAEFVARGSLAELAAAVAQGRAQLAEDLATMDATALPRRPAPKFDDWPWAATQGGVAMHLYEELSQHLGQMELTRDVLLDG